MKKFCITIIGFIIVPLAILLCLYLIADPFKVIKPFALDYCDDTNRDYQSSELFILNNPTYNYNSFVFGSSRCGGINTYHWKQYLPEDSRQFLFQAWDETITGIVQKIQYVDRCGNDIDNALILFDVEGTFQKTQLKRTTISIKDYHVSGESAISYHTTLFYNFLQRPSVWRRTISGVMSGAPSVFKSDPVSNDYDDYNRFRDISVAPTQDSLANCSEKSRTEFLSKVARTQEQKLSKPVLNDEMLKQLMLLADVLKKHNSSFKILITPGCCYTAPAINPADLSILQSLFGEENVYDFSGKNEISLNPYNFSDPNHFDLNAGWKMINEIYSSECCLMK